MLQVIIKEYSPDIICLQESNLKPDSSYSNSQFQFFSKTRNNTKRASGGVVTLISKSLQADHFHVNSDIETLVVKLTSHKTSYICNIYIAPDSTIEYKDLENLLNQIPSPRIIIGDFNAHNITWGSKSTNSRGHILEKLIADIPLNFLNDGTHTRLNISTGETSAIDLSLCDPALSANLSWEALSYSYGSDHFSIIIENRTSPGKCSPKYSPKWRINSADWTSFSNQIELNMDSCDNTNDVQKCVLNFNKIILDSASQHIGQTKDIKGHTPVPWWNQDCEKAIREAKAALNKYRKHKTLQNRVELKKYKAKAQLVIKQSKKKSWQEYVSGINSSTPINKVWTKIRKMNGHSSKSTIRSIKHNDRYYSSTIDIANILGQSYQEQSSTSNFTRDFLNNKAQIEQTPISFEDTLDNPLNLPITIEELDSSLEKMKNSSSSPDNIPVIFLKYLPPSAKRHLLKLFNKTWEDKVFPSL
ncbi:uncharacterized protein LOC130444674 [Diorhabda sublineata]|uniref:uncharacterized protein LOC130444674 n=1 Tax=Diorhabda sublineata TaxID=1163346 RepID=UPI0024E11672|nr:uncharacterized protein LOC130444674 [Diorhabda sublineata]